MKYHHPKISVITVTYNSERFLEKCILSVIEQNYPNLEYIIIDGGSTDKTIDIIKKYKKHLSYWVSEKDQGPPDAYNKGIDVSTGDLVNFLNSDDLYANNALFEIARKYYDSQEKEFDMITCGVKVDYLEEDGKKPFYYCTKENLEFNLYNILFKNFFFNSYFFKGSIIKKFRMHPLFDGSIFLTNDSDHLIRLALNYCRNIVIEKPLYIYQASNLSFSFSGKNFVRQRIEWCATANRYLSEAKSQYEKKLLKQFYYKSQTSLLLYYLTKCEFRKFYHIFRKELSETGALWLYKFLECSLQISYGRICRNLGIGIGK